MWFDSHCHLHLCEAGGPVEEVIARAHAAGVSTMVTIGIDVESSKRAVSIAQRNNGVYASVGVHPNDADQWEPQTALAIESALAEDCVIAVGESGLDFYRDAVSPEAQAAAFRDHIRLAKEFDKVLVIHTRESVAAALDVVDEEGPPGRILWHCWSGDEQQLNRALAMGSCISFAGNLSFKSARQLRDVAPLVPQDRLLVETDSPFLSPVPFRGKPNEPARVIHVGEAVAMARGTTTDAVARSTTDNALRLFDLDQ